MEKLIVFAPDLTAPDRLLLENLSNDISLQAKPFGANGAPSTNGSACGSGASGLAEQAEHPLNGHAPNGHTPNGGASLRPRETGQIRMNGSHKPPSALDGVDSLKALNDPSSDAFEPTVFMSVDLSALKLHPLLDSYLLQPYVRWARQIARAPTDVVMITHLILYFTTSVPSAVYLFRHFTLPHGILHFVMQAYYVGTYTLMMHQHIHMRGILTKKLALFDRIFPYITDPLMGHTWNTYFYHHVKHHHVEGNGPDDLSSTLRFQRDNPLHFLYYLGRFYFLIWLDLPLYFLSKKRPLMAAKAAFWELSNYALYVFLATMVHFKATLFVFILPLLLMRIGLMVGNWGQHAFVDADEPDSDFRSSITLIDVASNRYCFNDGYHTSHHLNPLRHWRDHPGSFLQQKQTYAKEGALVFHNIDYLMITVRLLMKDYDHLARCMVPIGDQISLTLEQRAALLRRHARRFTEEEISQKFARTQ